MDMSNEELELVLEVEAPPATQCYTLTELWQLESQPSNDVVGGLMAEGETILLVGRPKVGKSRLMLQLAISLSAGEPFLSFTVPKARRVLILDLENRPITVRERILKMAPGRRKSDDNIVIYAPQSLSTESVGLDKGNLPAFEQLVERVNPDVIIIDTWRLLLGPKDENKSEVVVEALKNLARLKSARPHLLVIIVHHLRKQGTSDAKLSLIDDPVTWVENVSGHHALVGHVDACYGIEREHSRTNMLDGEQIIVFGVTGHDLLPRCSHGNSP